MQDTTQQATQAAVEQTPQATQQTQEQTPQQTTAQSQQTEQTKAPGLTPEQIVELQTRASRAEQLEENYKHLQAEFTRRSQALAQLTGAQPQLQPQDPLAPYIQKLVSQGYDEKDARAIVSVSHEMTQPLQQQLQQAQIATQQSAFVGDVMRQAWASAPHLFADPEVAQNVEAILRNEALRGQKIDAEYALDAALITAGRKNLKAPTGNQQGASQQQPQFRSMFGAGNSFSPQAPTTQSNAIPAHIKEAMEQNKQWTANHFNFQKPA